MSYLPSVALGLSPWPQEYSRTSSILALALQHFEYFGFDIRG